MSSSGSRASWAWSQSGCQSPGQPISVLWLPGTDTSAGWVDRAGAGAAGPPASVPSSRPRRTSGRGEAARRSLATSRYSTRVPGRHAGDVVEDRGTARCRRCRAGATRPCRRAPGEASPGRSRSSGSAPLISARPAEVGPAAGRRGEAAPGAGAGVRARRSAFQTAPPSGGHGDLHPAVRPGRHRGVGAVDRPEAHLVAVGVEVGGLRRRRSCSTATRYSTCRRRSIRLKAKMPARRRRTGGSGRRRPAPGACVAQLGQLGDRAVQRRCRCRSRSCRRRDRRTGWPRRRTAGVLVANMSCRASLSPPAPMKPCSSP